LAFASGIALRGERLVTIEKNNTMYFWRVIFTFIIALHHLRNCYGHGVGWYIGVDFFAITSGYLLIQHIEKHAEETLWQYALKRFFQFCPIVFVTSFIRLLVEAKYNHYATVDVVDKLFRAIPDYLLLNVYEVSIDLNSVDWYIQALFPLSIAFFYLLQRHKVFTCQFLAPLGILISYSYLFKEYGYLEGYMPKGKLVSGIINMSLIRVGGGMMLGMLSYYGSSKILRYSSLWRHVLEIFCFVFVIYMTTRYNRNNVELVYLLLVFCGITLAFTHETQNRFLSSKFMKYLSSLSLYIYLSHYFVRIILRNEVAAYSYSLQIGYIVLITFISAGLKWFIEKGLAFLQAKH
jgi:peptidoglycan/LPS O-acetylase OafA/YrhL